MKALYELKNVEQYYDDKKVLDIKELTIDKGGIIGFFGPNGSENLHFFIFWRLNLSSYTVRYRFVAQVVQKLVWR